ncbi:Peptidoglycan lipid II flippase MurJ [uncultured Gammaproteobacteria bacterium]|jgi:putative peptidoglycan lipid II flippase|nr:Peptidoglycan lipid II flippase MurJ [uncultured Gammaproteobacteria bacterium]CAC9557748.1 Peptidoglycan lipid II flippase MurJ [uncultured Gammaproteobacteria bacterium]CAC9559709.1 Peptidoglycan lipid II flippase MurJ [uncultured Gammaproteobacteria bacterium]CAC9562658.1 Peptidoglycan lipid II flippase MurJ [uncultured Gammaproteobacteria bacterium]CAC9573861.1 Peptidoglycan lipid II flippase MurJ [uncultured Gammaproteobacteria bacterium]
MTFISRILGLIRDYIVARYFGANGLTDAFLVAFKIPNFLRRLFGEGAFSQAFVPILADAKANHSEAEVQNIINHIGTKFLTILIILTLIAVVIAPAIIFMFAWGFYFDADPTKFNLATDMLRITFPYLLLISLTAFAGSILNTYDKFAVPAFTPVLLNISMILCAVYLSENLATPIMALAWGVLIGGVVQLLFQIPFLIKIKKMPHLVKGNHQAVKTLKKRLIPALFGVSVSQINLLIDTMIATVLTSGSVSWLYYSDRLLELPLALIGIALATVALAKLSRHFANKDEQKFTRTVDYALKIGLILGAPACIGLILLAEPLMITLFQYDKFNAFAAHQSALSLMAYGTGLMAFIAIKILAPVFLARGDTKTPVKVGIIAMGSNVFLNVILAYYYAHTGLAIATSISAVINASLLYYYLNQRTIFTLSKNFFKLFLKVLLATIIITIFILNFNQTINDYLYANAWNRVLEISYVIGLSVLIYFISLRLLGVKMRKL